MNKPPAFQFYAADFLVDAAVKHMTLEERGAFVTLLAHSWIDGPLPRSAAKLATLCGVSVADMTRLWPALKACWKPAEKAGFIINPRMEKERRKQTEYREKLKWDKDEQRFLYAIVDSVNGRIKIGWSRNPAGRLKALAVDAQTPLELLGTKPGTMLAERKAHLELTAYHLGGEWFKDNAAVRAWLVTSGFAIGDTVGQTAVSPSPSPRTTKSTPSAPRRDEWVIPFGAAWGKRFEGTIPWGRIGHALKPLRDTYSDDEMLARWSRYLAQARAGVHPPETFAQTFGDWGIAKISPAPGVSRDMAIRRALDVLPTLDDKRIPRNGFPSDEAFQQWLSAERERMAS